MDLNEAALSLYNVITNLNNSVTATVGLDTLWARAVPYKNSEDVIIQEYTLLNVECPKEIRVVTNKTDYNPGNFTVDLFGISYEAPLEISIDLSTWQTAYGTEVMPQKDDVVYIKILHKLYEVKSSTIYYGVGEMPQYYKVTLAKYNPTASRRESDDLRQSIDDLTVSQQTLFGDAISDEVADITDPTEFGQMNTTYRDSLKTFNMDSITAYDLYSEHVLVSDSYYTFPDSSSKVTYDASCDYSVSSEKNHLVFSCWFNAKSSEETWNVTIDRVYDKKPAYWSFLITTSLRMEVGDYVEMFRGSVLRFNGKISKKLATKYIIDIATSDVLRANKKLTDWYSKGAWKIRTSAMYNLLSGLSDASTALAVNLRATSVELALSSMDISFSLPKKFDSSAWHYLGLDICPGSSHIVVIENVSDTSAAVVLDETKRADLKDTSFTSFMIDNESNSLKISNIRLYEYEYAMTTDKFKMDSKSRYIRNGSKVVIADCPNIGTKTPYIGSSK